jgi:ribosome-associated heat shock protein Hsp15
MDIQKVRLDQFLWAIRLFKTRSLANKAITDGKVKLNGVDVKPSRAVVIGDVYNVRTSEKKQSIQVIGIIAKRVAYNLAILNYYDVSTEEEKEFNSNKQVSSFYTGKRLSNVGRPTKKESRDLRDFLDPNEI